MCKRRDIINNYYSDATKEDVRLEKSRHGQMEYSTTMHYINKYAPNPCKVIEIGAGPGRYTVDLARKGYEIVAVDFSDNTFELLEKNTIGFKNISIFKDDAIDLSRFEDDTFDLTLLLGPMYHLFEKKDIQKAISEAIRVTKPNGIIMTSFFSVHFLLFDTYYDKKRMQGLKDSFTPNWEPRHYQEQIITRFDIDEFEALFNNLNVEYLTTLTTDGIIKHIEDRGFLELNDEEFDSFMKYHLHYCEKRELLGSSCHLLHICKKK